MKIHTEYAQGSLEWLVARSGIPTASEFDQILTPEFKVRTGQMPASYLAKKVAEWWQGGPLPGFTGLDMDFGHILEDEALPWYELECGEKVQRVAFITNDEGTIGCSPDGLIGDDGGIEVKSPEAHTHVKYLLANEVPKDYIVQVHGSMYVTGRPWWKFLSYRRRFPMLVFTLERDDEIQESIDTALRTFLAHFEAAKAYLIDLNGGPPKRSAITKQQPKIEDPAWVEDIMP